MKTLIHLTFLLLLATLYACGQESSSNYDNYTKLEIETEKCLDDWFDSRNVSWNELQTVFENYFASGKISNPSDSKDKQYQDILNYWQSPSYQFPVFKDKKKVVAIKNKLGLSDQDVIIKTQLNCFTNNYIDNKATVDTTSSYYVFGATLETIKQVPNISPGVIAGAINLSMDKADLKKELYQKTIVLMYCFDMSLFLSDGTE